MDRLKTAAAIAFAFVIPSDSYLARCGGVLVYH